MSGVDVHTELAALAKDAARYRWLRNRSNEAPDDTPTVYPCSMLARELKDSPLNIHSEALDAAIDAAIATGEQP